MNESHHSNCLLKEAHFKQEMSRLISAAVINQQFRSMLLNDPAAAVSAGYKGEQFTLAEEEKVQLGQMRAVSLAEFAAQIAAL